MYRKLFLSLFLIGTSMFGSNYAIVSMKKNNLEIETNDIKKIFLLETRYINGVKVSPINIDPNNKAREYVNSKVLNMTNYDLEKYWVTEHFKGVKPPYSLASFESIQDVLLNMPDSIGYLPVDMVDKNNMKVYYEF
jgi:hypothetical protein